MRLALVIPGMGRGGAERILSGLANRWSRAGHEVTIVTIDAQSGDSYDLDREVRRIALDLTADSRNVAEGALRGVRRIRALRRSLVALEPDVVLGFMRSVNVLTLLAAAGTGLRVFVSERTDPRLDPGARAQPAWAALRRLLYPRAAGVVMQTESAAAWARAFCPRVYVIPNFVERPPRLADPGVVDGPKRLVALGRLGPEKGFDLLVQAFARVAGGHPDWSLAIVGEGRERARLEALVREHGLAGRVSLPGATRNPSEELAASHAFVLSSRREGFPNALLEAMAAGLAVVAFDCRSGPAEIVRHQLNGILVPDGDVAALALALDDVMGSASERARLGATARAVVDAYAPERVVARWTALLNEGVSP